MPLITKDNLNEKSLTNAEVLALLDNISSNIVDLLGRSRILDAIEDLTEDRYFDEKYEDEISDAKKSLSLMIVKDAVLK